MDLNAASFDEILRFVDLGGVLANAILGGIAARTARLDMVGFVILAILSGLGGGLIRDTLLQQGPPVALTDPAYLAIAITGAFIAFFVPFRGRWSQRSLVLIDALAIGSWAAVGAQKTLEADLGWLAAVAMGIVTAVGGGAVRDVMLLRIPRIFGGNTLYATSALVSSVEMVVLSELGMPTLGSLVAMATGALLSLLARRYGWTLPTEVRIPRPRLWSDVARSFRRRRQEPDASEHGGEPLA
ncbi:MAG: trimeric intracellular cation channel family protein [Mycetocola sp.]